MARITVEDCIDKFPSRFELVLVASNRARKLHSGETPTVEKDNDKNTVIALREIADETLGADQLKNDLIEEYQTTSFTEEEEEERIDDDTNKALTNEENEISTEIINQTSEEKNIDDENIIEQNNIIEENQESNEDSDSTIDINKEV